MQSHNSYLSSYVSFDELSVEEKTERLLSAIGEDFNSIYSPTYPFEDIQERKDIDRKFTSMAPYGYDFSSSPQKDIFSLVITDSEVCNILQDRVKDLELASFENYKLGMDILVRYDDGVDRLLHQENDKQIEKKHSMTK